MNEASPGLSPGPALQHITPDEPPDPGLCTPQRLLSPSRNCSEIAARTSRTTYAKYLLEDTGLTGVPLRRSSSDGQPSVSLFISLAIAFDLRASTLSGYRRTTPAALARPAGYACQPGRCGNCRELRIPGNPYLIG